MIQLLSVVAPRVLSQVRYVIFIHDENIFTK
jgi:hypothetical protein